MLQTRIRDKKCQKKKLTVKKEETLKQSYWVILLIIFGIALFIGRLYLVLIKQPQVEGTTGSVTFGDILILGFFVFGGVMLIKKD